MNSFFNKKIRLLYFIIICLVLVAGAVVLTYSAVIGGLGSKAAFDDAKRYVEIEKLIADNYVEKLDEGQLYDSAAAAMVRSLNDKWSYYMTAEQYQAYRLSNANEYAGIGVSIRVNDDGEFEISAVDAGTPAANAGLSVGQRIVSIDGEKTKGMSLSGVQALIRSKLNHDFKIGIEDKKGNESVVTVACELLYSSPVSHKLLDNGVGYIRIANFEAGAGEDTIAAIEYLISIGADSFIFDLRDDPGGLQSELTQVLDYVLPDGDLLISVDKNGHETVTRSDKVCLKYKIAVIVNANTYSFAEFFAAAIQEYNWGSVVGEQTTGKSRSQVTIELPDGGALHISGDKYLTPNRVDLALSGGVTPNVPVLNTEPGVDQQLEAAVKTLN